MTGGPGAAPVSWTVGKDGAVAVGSGQSVLWFPADKILDGSPDRKSVV